MLTEANSQFVFSNKIYCVKFCHVQTMNCNGQKQDASSSQIATTTTTTWLLLCCIPLSIFIIINNVTRHVLSACTSLFKQLDLIRGLARCCVIQAATYRPHIEIETQRDWLNHQKIVFLQDKTTTLSSKNLNQFQQQQHNHLSSRCNLPGKRNMCLLGANYKYSCIWVQKHVSESGSWSCCCRCLKHDSFEEVEKRAQINYDSGVILKMQHEQKQQREHLHQCQQQ